MTEPNPYDEIPYPTAASQAAHPDRLATIATLFGMTPAAISRCRVLELACGDGGNLLSVAFWHPESRFVGIDLAERPIAAGKEVVAHLGLKNLTLEAKDILTITPEFGEFDYIIAHGLYAWVPPVVQDKLLAVCRANLAPQGVAFVSYNCYPGSRMREMVRDLLLQYAGPRGSSPESLARAVQLLGFAEQPRKETGDWGPIMNQLSEFVRGRSENVLAHDEMGEQWRPAYFREFMARAEEKDLAFLGEASFSEMNDRWLSPEELELLASIDGDPLLVREQYKDFLKCRSFRQTLLCRRETKLRRSQAGESILKLLVSTRLRPVSARPELDSTKAEEFRSPAGGSLTLSIPPMKRLLARLAEAWPRRIPIAELVSKDIPAPELGEIILRLYASNLVSVQTHWNPYVARAGERPEASRLARLLVERREQVTNQEHIDVMMTGALSRELLRLLDGTRDRAALLAELRKIDPSATPEALEISLTSLADLAFLTA